MLDRSKVQEVFADAAGLGWAEVGAFLDRVCGGDGALRAEVESLLGAAARHPGFLGTPTAAPPGAEGEGPGTRIGVYRLLQEIGRGGFGSVYMAEQEEPVRRRVALKIIKLGMDTRAVIARFEAERQALALMDHANIARVFDAGATESGRPYFVMELVKGDPITAYCDRNNLNIPERLGLFAQVCQAVQHAHAKGVIHRDIKPSNVLVAIEDGRPHVKVIDFGIAKATAHRLTEKTVFTDFRQFIGTPEYMSPEQAEGSLNIDIRSDVYSLGVLLYELLTGGTPFDQKTLRSAAFAEVQRIIREVEPPRPSTRLSQSGSLAEVASHRRSEPARLSALVRGDLDWIVMRALDKEQARRYETASALGADIALHLAGQPVEAAPPSLSYRARKFVRRNRALVSAGAIVVGTLVLGITGTTWGLFGARRAERQTGAERDRAAIVGDFLARTFEGISPQVALGRDTALLGNLMDKAAARIDAGAMRGNIGAERELRLVIAGVYTDLARYDDALRVLRPVREAPEGALPAPLRLRLDLLAGRIGWMTAEWEGAEKSLRAVVDAVGASPAPDEHARAEALSMLGEVAIDRTQFDQSIDLHTRAVGAARAVTPADDELLMTCLSRLGGACALSGKNEEAARALDEAMTILSRPEWSGSPMLVDALISRSMLLIATRPQDAVAEMRTTVATARRIFPSAHPKIALSLYQLGAALYYVGEYEQALACQEESLVMRRGLFGDESPETLESLAAKGSSLSRLGRYEEAIRCTREALAVYCKRSPDGSYDEAHERMMLAISLRGMGDTDGAIAEGTRAVEGFKRFAPADDTKPLACAQNLAACLRDAGRLEESAAAYRGLIREVRVRAPTKLANIAGTQFTLAQVLLDMQTPEGAKEAEDVLRECLETRRKLLPDGSPDVWVRYQTMSVLGSALVREAGSGSGDAAGRLAEIKEAESLLLDGYAGLKEHPAPPGPAEKAGPGREREALERIVALYEAWDSLEPGAGHAEQAARWRERAAGPPGGPP